MRATPLVYARTLPQGFDYVDNKVKDLDPSAPYENLASMCLTLTRQDEVIIRGEQVKSVQICTASGELGINPCHEYKISKLIPGVLTVEVADGKTLKYFTSGGFAHLNNIGAVDINTVECILLEDLDVQLAEKELTAVTEQQKNGKTESEKAVGEAMVQTLEAVVAALKAGGSGGGH